MKKKPNESWQVRFVKWWKKEPLGVRFIKWMITWICPDRHLRKSVGKRKKKGKGDWIKVSPDTLKQLKEGGKEGEDGKPIS